MSQDLAATIDAAWENRAELGFATQGEARIAVDRALALLDRGEARVAEPDGQGGWTVNQWLKKAVLLSFRLNDNVLIDNGPGAGHWFDKVPSKFSGWSEADFRAAGFRAVPGSVVRRGAHVAKGAILIDGQDIRDVRLDSARDALGVVPQDCVLFHDTIEANIRYARPSATMDEVREAARMAAFSAFVESLPQGYDTIVGDRGLKLSGGERQRLAIARAYLKNPRIFILDEATSSLDSATEAEIVRNFARAGEGRTQLIIAHRLSTVMHADQILVLDEGALVERGTHAELLANNGLYAGLWQRQTEQQNGG